MPTTTSIGRESCGGRAVAATPRRCYTTSISTAWPRRWVADPAALESKATELGLSITELLCVGCNRKLARLQAEGLWP